MWHFTTFLKKYLDVDQAINVGFDGSLYPWPTVGESAKQGAPLPP
jgi:hypothetical protein